MLVHHVDNAGMPPGDFHPISACPCWAYTKQWSGLEKSRRLFPAAHRQRSVPASGKKQTTNKRHGYPSADTLFLTSGIGVSDSHGMDIIFTQHARARMADPHRGVVTAEDIRAVLASPTVDYVGIDGKQNVLGEANGKHIRSCFVEDQDRLLIITVINRGTRL